MAVSRICSVPTNIPNLILQTHFKDADTGGLEGDVCWKKYIGNYQ